jgi:hypothetical protein
MHCTLLNRKKLTLLFSTRLFLLLSEQNYLPLYLAHEEDRKWRVYCTYTCIYILVHFLVYTRIQTRKLVRLKTTVLLFYMMFSIWYLRIAVYIPRSNPAPPPPPGAQNFVLRHLPTFCPVNHADHHQTNHALTGTNTYDIYTSLCVY